MSLKNYRVCGILYFINTLCDWLLWHRTDEDRSQYTGVLCGLGWDPSTGKGLHEDHDIECTFDTVITQEDFDQVNGSQFCFYDGEGICIMNGNLIYHNVLGKFAGGKFWQITCDLPN